MPTSPKIFRGVELVTTYPTPDDAVRDPRHRTVGVDDEVVGRPTLTEAEPHGLDPKARRMVKGKSSGVGHPEYFFRKTC